MGRSSNVRAHVEVAKTYFTQLLQALAQSNKLTESPELSFFSEQDCSSIASYVLRSTSSKEYGLGGKGDGAVYHVESDRANHCTLV